MLRAKSARQQPADIRLPNSFFDSYTFNTITRFPGIPSTVTIQRSAQVRVAPATPQ